MNLQILVEQWVSKQIANKSRHKKRSDMLYKMAISIFQNFEFLNPKIQKNILLKKNQLKIQNFKDFFLNLNIC